MEPKGVTGKGGAALVAGAMCASQAAFPMTSEAFRLWRRQFNSYRARALLKTLIQTTFLQRPWPCTETQDVNKDSAMDAVTKARPSCL